MAANTSIPLLLVGCPEMLALVPMSGRPIISMMALAVFATGLAYCEPSGISSHLEGHFGGCGDDHGQRAGPEMACQQIETGGKFLGDILRHDYVAH